MLNINITTMVNSLILAISIATVVSIAFSGFKLLSNKSNFTFNTNAVKGGGGGCGCGSGGGGGH